MTTRIPFREIRLWPATWGCLALALLLTARAGAEDVARSASEPSVRPYATAFESHPLPLDPAHVATGRRTFRVLAGGRQVGLSVVETALHDGHYVIHESMRIEPDEIREDVLLRLDAETFAPRTALLSADAGGVHLSAQYRVAGQKLEGLTSRYDSSDGRYDEYPVARDLPPGTFFRGSAFALAQAMPLDRGEPLKLNWFAPEHGVLALAWLEVTGTETVTVPAGTFETFRVVQKDGMVGMVLSVTTAAPRQVVRAQAFDSPYVLELMPSP